MSTSDPWVTLGRTFEESCRILRDPAREVYVALEADGEGQGEAATPRVAGFTIIIMQGARSSATSSRSPCTSAGAAEGSARRSSRSRSGGSCATSLTSSSACRRSTLVRVGLYERLGYEVVGELKDFVVRGHSEILLRKTTGPLAEHVPRSDEAGGFVRSARGGFVTERVGDPASQPYRVIPSGFTSFRAEARSAGGEESPILPVEGPPGRDECDSSPPLGMTNRSE